MLPINVQDVATDPLTLLAPLLLCCMLPMLFRGGSQQTAQQRTETDSWYVTYAIQDTYDTIVKESDEWRRRAASRKKKGWLSFLSRREPVVFEVDQSVPPRLYRLKDDQMEEVSFELTEVAEGGTSVKTTYGTRARSLIQDLRAKMPVNVPASTTKVCSSCGKQMKPDFAVCPFCGTKIE